MKRFLARLSLFFVPLLLANAPAYYIVHDVTYGEYRPPRGMQGYRSFLLADSHGFVLENALAPYGVCNLSNNSDNYADAYRKIAYLLRNGFTVDRVYLTADEHTLSTYREDAANFYMSLYYYGDYESYRNSAQGANPFTFAYAKWLRPYLPLLQTDNAYFINNYFARRLKGEAAFENKPKVWNDTPDRAALTKARIENQFRNGGQSVELKTMLIRIAELCRRNGATLVGIKFPLTRDYLQQLGPRSCHADSVFLQCGLRVIDMQTAYAANDSLFRDQDHLSPAGVKLFAAQLADSIRADRSALGTADSIKRKQPKTEL